MARSLSCPNQGTSSPDGPPASPPQAHPLARQQGPSARAAVIREAEDPRAAYLTRLVTDHLDFVWRLLRRLGLDGFLADDVTQEVFLVAVRRLRKASKGRYHSRSQWEWETTISCRF